MTQHYTTQLELSKRAQIAAAAVGDEKEEAKQKGLCDDYEKLIAKDMKKVWERNRVN